MLKKIICIFMFIVMCLSNLSSIVWAKENTSEYYEEDKESIYKKYMYNEEMLEALFNSDKAVYYWKMVNNIEKNDTLKWSLDVASKLIGESPDKKKYAEILTNLMVMQSGDLAEQIEQQNEWDGLRAEEKYVGNIMDIAKSFIGGAEILKSISPIVDAATGGIDVLIESVEQAKYYETILKDYSQSKLFLEAVSNYSNNDGLKSVSSSLLAANDKLLEKRLEYVADSMGKLANFEAQFFLENLSFELLKTADIYSTDDTVRWFVDCGSNLASSFLSIKAAGEFAFHMTMLVGDIGFGTTNAFNRYQEIKVIADIANAIVEANSRIETPSRYDEMDAINRIRTKCDYYRILITTHARGEYLIFQLLKKDAGLLSKFRVLFDSFKAPEETTEDCYNRQVAVMLEYIEILDNMFSIKRMSNIKKDMKIPSDAAEYNGHYYYVYELDDITTWDEAKEYCKSQGGYLATITSKNEDEFVYSYLRNNFEFESAYFGFTDQNEEGNWNWDNGEENTYTNWYLGEPNGDTNENFAMYYYKFSNGSWNDGDFGDFTVNGGKAFICEWSEHDSVNLSWSDKKVDINQDTLIQNEDYQMYVDACEKFMENGAWHEHTKMSMDMKMKSDTSSAKYKGEVDIEADVTGYDEEDLSNLTMTGEYEAKIANQKTKFQMDYADGKVKYTMTEPENTTREVEIDESFLKFYLFDEKGISNVKAKDNEISFIVNGAYLDKNRVLAINMLSGISNLNYGDISVRAKINKSTGKLEKMTMQFQAEFQYQGYDAEAEYRIEYMLS